MVQELLHVQGQGSSLEELSHVQGKEQWLRFAGAAMKLKDAYSLEGKLWLT